MQPTVILIHGLRTSATMWRQQLADLDARGIPALAIDLPGHGTRIGERFTLDGARTAIADAVESATASSGAAPYLVGFSLGGYLAIDWVGSNPGRVRGLLAAACGTVPHPIVFTPWRLAAWGIHLLPDRGLALNNFAVNAFVPSPGAEDVIAGGVALEVMDDALHALLSIRPLHSLRQIDVPVLFVNGRFDHVRLNAKRFLAATRRGRLITIPRSTHLVSLIRPHEFTAALLEGYAETV